MSRMFEVDPSRFLSINDAGEFPAPKVSLEKPFKFKYLDLGPGIEAIWKQSEIDLKEEQQLLDMYNRSTVDVVRRHQIIVDSK